MIAEEPTVVYRLTRASFNKMQAEDPAAAIAFHMLIIRLLSDRLEFAVWFPPGVTNMQRRGALLPPRCLII